MYKLIASTQFKKDLKKIKNNKQDFLKVCKLLEILEEKGVSGIPKRMRLHRLNGQYKDKWEFHIKPDLLIICIQFDELNRIDLVRIGSHSKLFK